MSDAPTPSRSTPVREDCWTEEATATLVDVWGRRYLELKRGNLRRKDWQEVADAVNSCHGHSKKTFRTDVQCKNRVDTVKKKYKSERARVSSSPNGPLVSSWRFYDRLHELIGSSSSVQKSLVSVSSPPLALPWQPRRKAEISSPAGAQLSSLPQKRPARVDESYFRRNYSTVAAAAAAAGGNNDADDDDEDGDEDDEEDGDDQDNDGSEESRSNVEGDESGDGSNEMRKLARAIERFGEVYERVEAEKQKQMIELEKQRMQFAKDMELQRMQMFMKTQVQLEKLKRAKGSGSDDIYN